MKLELLPLTRNLDKSNPAFAHADCQQALQIYTGYYAQHGYAPPWIAYFTLLDGVAVGLCSFTGAPVNDRVEVAYWTFAGNEGKGIASFGCRALVRIAREASPTPTVYAKTAPEQNASTRILEKHGFVKTGVVTDHEIGDAWYWELAP